MNKKCEIPELINENGLYTKNDFGAADLLNNYFSSVFTKENK